MKRRKNQTHLTKTMVKYETIIKVIENEINKCKATAQAKNIGATGKWTEEKGQWGETLYALTYDDGTRIVFDENQMGIEEYSNSTEGFFANNTNINFTEDGEYIRQEYGAEGLMQYIKYTNYKMSGMGMKFNQYLRGLCTKEEFYKNLEDTAGHYSQYLLNGLNGTEIADLLYNNHKQYETYCNIPSKNEDFITARRVERLHSNDNIDKRIVYDKGYTSSTTQVKYLNGIDRKLNLNKDESWTIITEYHKGNTASHGLSLTYAELDIGIQNWGEYLNPPYQKMKRKIIDEKNKIIVQECYEPST